MSTSKIRKELNLTQKEFSEKFHFPLRTVQNWESRNCCPDNVYRLICYIVQIEKTYKEALDVQKAEYEKQIEFYQNLMGV